MELRIQPDAESAARYAANYIAGVANSAIRSRGCFTFAVSGGSTPWLMLRVLAGIDLPWKKIHLFQVDERILPAGDPGRNLTQLRNSLLQNMSVNVVNIYPMPVEIKDVNAAALKYVNTLQAITGSPAKLDLIHLGLGGDGHTASLIPGDAALDLSDADVAISGVYKGCQRMTLTYPILNRAHHILWLVTGQSKANMLKRLLAADSGIPAGKVCQDDTIVIADELAIKKQ